MGSGEGPLHATAIAMTFKPNPDHIKLLVEIIEGRQKFPRALSIALLEVEEASHETTGRIFYDCGGPTTWASYFQTKWAIDNTVNLVARSKRLRMISWLEEQPIEVQQAFARHLASALEHERERIERILETGTYHASRRRQRQSNVESCATASDHTDTPDTPTLASPKLASPSITSRTQASEFQPSAAWTPFRGDFSPGPQAMDLRNMAQYFSEPGQALTHAVISECTRIFPPYLARAIRRYPLPENPDIIAAAVSITLPRAGWTACLMRIEVVGSKIDHIAHELFDAHLEVEDGCRYIVMPGGAMVGPNPRLVLVGCRLDRLHHFFGARVADAIRSTPTCQMDIKEGSEQTSCVSMSIPSAVDGTGDIYALLCQSDAELLRESLYF
ncbi:hypothetical protein FJTKL_01395 [Diaporthe vaccinii]|uniref:Uncharacterized protein n=1 Tax=Diaporthe vaccinii TaxID=105482 RepID=A0ABR4E0P1_9PEZI